ATPPRAAAPRPADKGGTAGASAPVKGQPQAVPTPRTAKPAEAKPATAPRTTAAPVAAKSSQPGPATPAARVSATGDKTARAPARPANGSAGAPPAAARLAAASSVPRPAAAKATGKAVPGAGEPYPPMSEGLINGAAAGKSNKHLAPRSPRTALEPDTVEMPPSRRSKRARHPFVVIGNAIITLFILAAVVAAFGLVVGKQRFDAPGPLAEDRVVNIA